MRRTILKLIPTTLLVLTGCNDAMYQQQYAVQQPPTLTQTQGRCFSTYKDFNAQTNCIRNGVITSGFAIDAPVQEYLLLMESLREKVAHKKLTESDARLKLASKLSELKALQQNDFMAQQQLENQRAAQNAEVLRQYQANIIRPEPYQPVIKPYIQTNCQTLGNQLNCTSR